MLAWTALVILALSVAAYGSSRARALSFGAPIHSRPSYHGAFIGVWTAIAGFGVLLVGIIISAYILRAALYAALPPETTNLAEIERELILSDAIAQAEGRLSSRTGDVREQIATLYVRYASWRKWIVAILAVGSALFAFRYCFARIAPEFRARNRTEAVIRGALIVAAGIAILTTLGIVLSLTGQTFRFFGDVGIGNFLFGTHWSPLSGVHSGEMNPDKVGAIPLFAGTLLITGIAMLVAVPTGLLAAIYLSDYATPRFRATAKPLLEILAGIPTVVYGFFAAIVVAPLFSSVGEASA